ncbi:MAG TPA: hypothetical protein VF086_08990 [Propionibacteriaceae bacterium]
MPAPCRWWYAETRSEVAAAKHRRTGLAQPFNANRGSVEPSVLQLEVVGASAVGTVK